jgi:hypothetical protein
MLRPFSNTELAEKSGIAARDIGRYRYAIRSPKKGANVRALAQALVDLRTEHGIPGGDLVATFDEVWNAARSDSKRRSTR